MFTEGLFTKLLQLEDGWFVESVETDFKQEEIYIQIACILDQLEDAETGELCKVYEHAPVREWRHLDTMQYRTFLRCKLPRIITPSGKVKTVQPNWASDYGRTTFLFETAVIDLLKASKNQTKTAKFMRCGFNVVNSIMHRSVKRGMDRRSYDQIVFDHLSIDEKSFKKGHNYVTVLSHPDSGCVIDVEEDRTKETCKKLLNKSLTEKQLEGVSAISMDMWQAYMQTAQEILPNAAIVHDRFHLVKYLNEAIDKVRRSEVKNHQDLKNSRYVLLKNPENLTEKQRFHFEAIADANYEVSKAWQVRENFKDLFGSSSLFATSSLLKWMTNAYSRKIAEIDKVVNMFKSHLNGVINALTERISNAMAERLNGKIQELKTVGRGYRTFTNFRSAILFFNGGLNLYPH
ncbi:ISL3 family transposase [Algoriphagus sp.]|uniref:ISL3 family transposase n=1 Tax=Algoriphagus sp. TaxID=1872435 RepID=UPI00260278E7|nr:ISL3 family transposase [Algoriphagus sp.]